MKSYVCIPKMEGLWHLKIIQFGMTLMEECFNLNKFPNLDDANLPIVKDLNALQRMEDKNSISG